MPEVSRVFSFHLVSSHLSVRIPKEEQGKTRKKKAKKKSKKARNPKCSGVGSKAGPKSRWLFFISLFFSLSLWLRWVLSISLAARDGFFSQVAMDFYKASIGVGTSKAICCI